MDNKGSPSLAGGVTKFALAVPLGAVSAVLLNDHALHWTDPGYLMALGSACSGVVDGVLWLAVPVIVATRDRILSALKPKS
jgi:hypothetical protein